MDKLIEKLKYKSVTEEEFNAWLDEEFEDEFEEELKKEGVEDKTTASNGDENESDLSAEEPAALEEKVEKSENFEVSEEKTLTEEEIYNKLVVKKNEKDLDDIYSEMIDTLISADKYSWERGVGFKTGFKMLDEKLAGVQAGLTLVGAQSNVGKSSFLLQIFKSVTELNNVYGVYYTLDDTSRDLIPRIISRKKMIPINSIRMPMKYRDYPSVLEKRHQGFKELFEDIENFKIIDQNKGKSLKFIANSVRIHYNYIKEQTDKNLFICIDNFHDITTEENFNSDKNKFSYIAEQLRSLAEELKIPIWCTAELRKTDKSTRPRKEDIREANKIVYEANLILMLYNEVGLRKANSTIFYTTEGEPETKKPILEIHADKNKLSAFKGRLFYYFIPEMAHLKEVDERGCQRYNTLIYTDPD